MSLRSTDLPAHHYLSVEPWMLAPHTTWLATVGSRTFLNPNGLLVAQRLIEDALEWLDLPDRECGITSGAADGVDSIGEQIADEQWYRKCIFPPKIQQWEPDGFKARNERIGQVCSYMVAIRCVSAKTWGTGHAAEYAESLGKQVQRWVVCRSANCTGHSVGNNWRINGECAPG